MGRIRAAGACVLVILCCCLCVFGAKQTCPRPHVDNTVTVTPDRNSYHQGQSVTFKCSNSSLLLNATASSATCQTDGTWSFNMTGDHMPYCEALCPAAPSISNGNVSYPDGTIVAKITPGIVATYTCHDGYKVTGSPTVTCGTDGSWIGKTPTCDPNTCPPLPNCDHGNITLSKGDGTTPSAVGTTATYKCDSGYTINGGASLTCQASGKWSAAPPTCVVDTCPPLPNCDHGNITLSKGDGTTPSAVGTTATYKCDSGYTINGGASLTCQASGKWSAAPPTCVVAATCAPPAVGFKVIVSPKTPKGGSYAIGAKIHLSCPVGLTILSSALSATCGADGDWSVNFTASEPYCKAAECPGFAMMDPIPFGFINWTSQGIADPSFSQEERFHIYDAKVTYICDSGDSVVGSAERTCQANGTWSGLVPYCQVPNDHCAADSCKKHGASQTSCCTLNNASIGCCSKNVQKTISDRFDNVPPTCASSLQAELMPCGGRLIECMDFASEQKRNPLNCQPPVTFGCYRNQIAPTALGKDMDDFCMMYSETNKTLGCVADVQLTLTGTTVTQGLCLPDTCQTQDSLDSIVDSTLLLYRDNDILVAGGGYTQASGLKITCGSDSNLTSSSYPKYPVPCSSKNKCTQKGYPGWTKCCQLDGKNIGCCSELAQNVLTSRYEAFESKSKCKVAMEKLLSPCLSQLVQCYSNLTGVMSMTNKCPDLHGCSVPLQTNQSKCATFAGAGSTYCTRSCPGIANCGPASFCMPADCADAKSLNAIAMGDAQISCDLWHSGGNQYCSWVNVSISCDNGVKGTASIDDRAKFCSPPFTPHHGYFNVTRPDGATSGNYTIGTKVTYHCDYGYGPSDSNVVITCNTNGQWSRKGPDCQLVDCGKPIVAGNTGIEINGTGHRYGDVIHFSCPADGFHPIPASAKCQADKTWDYDILPYCAAANCPALFSWYGDNEHNPIPFGTVTLLHAGVNDSSQSGMDDHLYNAEISYHCDKHTSSSKKSIDLTCQANGSWTGPPVICSVPPSACNTSDSCKDLAGHPTYTECCAYGSESSGPLCCPKTTKSVLDARFNGLTGQCQADFTDAYRPCATQIVDCLNSPVDSCDLQVSTFYTYGCNSGVPSPRETEFVDELAQFCGLYGPNMSVPCLETQVTVFGETLVGKTACLPESCANSEEDLAAIAQSSLETYCASENNPFYCSTASVSLNCQNGIKGMASATATCNCPPSGQPTLTECCEVDGTNLGCCSKNVQKTVADRFLNGTSDACLHAQYSMLGVCGAAIISCLNQVELTSTYHECPDHHSCMAYIGADFCPANGGNLTAYCSSTCTGPWTCKPDTFCIAPECMNQADIQALAQEDANLACDVYKLSTGNTTCGKVQVRATCYGSDNSTLNASYIIVDKGQKNVTMCHTPFSPWFGGFNATDDKFHAGTNVTYYCHDGYQFTAQSKYPDYQTQITCGVFGGWEGHAPDCRPINCPDILADLNGGRFPYGTVTIAASGVNSTTCGGDVNPCTHTSGATLHYTCDKGTVAVGATDRVCMNTGKWSGTNVYCKVQAKVCDPNHNACPKDRPVCVTVGNNPAGVMCGTKKAQDLINKRFVGVTGLCLKELTASFSLCAAQIITCLNNMTAECVQQVTRYYMYGCNKGALVPKPDVDENRMHLKQFCTANGPSSALSCNQHKRNIDLTFAEPTSFCLPGSCSAQLDVIAKTMMNLQCSFLNSTELVCGLAEVDVNCQPANSNTSSVGVARPDTSCGQCPHPGQPTTATECCSLGKVNFGCCTKSTQAILMSRFGSSSAKCVADLSDLFLPCATALLECLNTGKYFSTQPHQNCPTLHGCGARATYGSGNCTVMTGPSSSFCTADSKDGTQSVMPGMFCLPASCSNGADIVSLARSESEVACQLYKQMSKKLACGVTTTNLTCQLLGVPHTKYSESSSFSDAATTPAFKPTTKTPSGHKTSAGPIVGGVFGGLAAITFAVIFFIYYRRRASNKTVRYSHMKNVQDDEDSALID